MFNLFGAKAEGYENIGPAEFKKKMDDGAVVIDVREKGELVEGSIPGHVMISMRDPEFFSKLQRLEKGNTYLIYCRSGQRSARTCEALADLGFDELYNLEGGIMAWNSQNA